MRKLVRVIALAFVVFALMAWGNGSSKSAYAESSQSDLTELSLEELMNLTVTLVSRKPQKISQAAAAIFVITQDDIRRSGVTTIPDALRMAPGLFVGRIDANKWSISARGFNGRFSNKLLVLMDGRSVYTPLFSGVNWDVQDTMLEDVERIEVIRGPGASLWGANAVNGIINIITKQAKDTQGGLLSTGGGTEEQGFGGVRYGSKLGDNAHYRLYAKYFNRDESVGPSGASKPDDWQILRGGFRLDWQATKRDALTAQGDIYDGKVGQEFEKAVLTPPFLIFPRDENNVAGGNLLMRWQRTISTTSELALQLYYDRTERVEAELEENRDTIDLDFQHQFALGKRQQFVWGFGYRFTRDSTHNSFLATFDPRSRSLNLYGGFLQDDITLIENRLRLTLGSKFEHNDLTGFEIQPTARLLWTPSEQHSIWGAVSRAVRTPSRAEHNVRFNRDVLAPFVAPNPLPLPILAAVLGNEGFDSEDLLAFELGYRVRVSKRFSLDMTAFFNMYDNFRTTEFPSFIPSFESAPPPPHLLIPILFDNKAEAETYGAELAADLRPLDWWRFRAAYTFIRVKISTDRDSTDFFVNDVENNTPEHQFSLRSSWDLPHNLELDAWGRYVDNAPDREVNSYITLDVRLAWRPTKRLELSLVGQNLLENQHPETTSEAFTLPAEVERSVYGQIRWRF